LNNLAVLPEYRHKGIGKQLLEHAYSAARDHDCKLMNIGIVEENTKLRKWYEENGAVHLGTHKFDYFPFTCGYMRKEL
jgi:GNAT superfamily N-acetyltransferase